MIKIKKVTKEDLKGTFIRAEHAYYPGISALYKALGIRWISGEKFGDFKPPFPPFSYECYESFLTYTRYPDPDDELFPPQSEIDHQWVRNHCPHIVDFHEAGYTLVEGDMIVRGDGVALTIGPDGSRANFNAYVLYSKQLYEGDCIPSSSLEFNEVTKEDFANTFIRKDSKYACWFINTIDRLGIQWVIGKKPLEYTPPRSIHDYSYVVSGNLDLYWLKGDKQCPAELTEIDEKWFRDRFPTLDQVLESGCKLVEGDSYIALDTGTTTDIGNKYHMIDVNTPSTIDRLLAVIKCKALSGETSKNAEEVSVCTTSVGMIDGVIVNPPQIQQPLVVGIKYTGDNLKEVLEFTGKHPRFDDWFEDFDSYQKFVEQDRMIFKIFDGEGGHQKALPGDYLIKEDGEIKVYKKA